MTGKHWLAETLFDDLGLRMSYAVDQVRAKITSGHQRLVLFDNRRFGKVLLLDGATQVTSRDAFIYHEMMSHVPVLAHGRARDVLVVGGGDCGIAREVLKHKSVRRLTQVEIDPAVIAFAKRHFPEFTTPVFRDSRFESVIADGMDYVAKTDRRFDVIIVDSTDPQGPGAVLFTRAFYAACKLCLKPGGVLVAQNGVPFLQPKELAASIRRLGALFADAGCYLAAVPTYVGGHLAMGFASDDIKLRKTSAAVLAARCKKAGGVATKYWTPEVQAASFALPRYIDDIVVAARRRR